MNTKQITCRPLSRALRRGMQRVRSSAIVLIPEKDRLDDYDTSHCVLTVAAGILLA